MPLNVDLSPQTMKTFLEWSPVPICPFTSDLLWQGMGGNIHNLPCWDPTQFCNGVDIRPTFWIEAFRRQTLGLPTFPSPWLLISLFCRYLTILCSVRVCSANFNFLNARTYESRINKWVKWMNLLTCTWTCYFCKSSIKDALRVMTFEKLLLPI